MLDCWSAIKRGHSVCTVKEHRPMGWDGTGNEKTEFLPQTPLRPSTYTHYWCVPSSCAQCTVAAHSLGISGWNVCVYEHVNHQRITSQPFIVCRFCLVFTVLSLKSRKRRSRMLTDISESFLYRQSFCCQRTNDRRLEAGRAVSLL